MNPRPASFALPLFLLSLWTGLGGNARAASSWDGKGTAPDYVLTATADRPDALYHQGETVTFTLTLQHDQQPADGSVDWVISKDGVPPLDKGTSVLQGGKATITGTLTEPGFLHCEAHFKTDKGVTLTGISAGGFDLFDIKPSLPVPDDFDAFWAAKKKELAAVPLNAKLTAVPLPPNRTGVDTFEYQADSIGAPSTGYYGRPTGATPKSLPALLFVPGAGVRSANLDSVAGWAKNGILVLDMNAHGIPNGKPSDFYGALDLGELKDYRTRGRESRDTYYFLGVYYRVLRAIEFLAEQPEWDGKTIIMIGVSQGGGLAFAGTALDPRISYMIAMVPGLSDHSGNLVGRIAGWPKAIPKGADGKPDPTVTEVMRYFDTANFATRIKVPVHLEVGFLDVTCPPTCSYVDYNNLTSKKEIVNHPENGHDLGPQIWNDMKKLSLAHIAEQGKGAATP